MNHAGALYRCRVMHHRPGKPRYRFFYRVFYLLIDLDAIDAACGVSRLISRNRFNLLSFYDKDHGHHNGTSLRAWADDLLREQGMDQPAGRIRLLSMPRVLGYGFNPISLYYCDDANGQALATIVEVHNTFGEHHVYVLDARGQAADAPIEQAKSKRFHVSPFFDRDGYYRFHVLPAGERMGLGVRLYDAHDTLRIATTLNGQHQALTSRAVLRAATAVPLQSIKVVAAIHWQALKIWLRGGVFHSKPDPERPNVS